MRTNRRGFFAILAGATAVPAIPAADAIPEPIDTLVARMVRSGPKIGDTILVRNPLRFVASDGLRFHPDAFVFEMDRFVVEDYGLRPAPLTTAEKFYHAGRIQVRFDPARLPA